MTGNHSLLGCTELGSQNLKPEIPPKVWPQAITGSAKLCSFSDKELRKSLPEGLREGPDQPHPQQLNTQVLCPPVSAAVDVHYHKKEICGFQPPEEH